MKKKYLILLLILLLTGCSSSKFNLNYINMTKNINGYMMDVRIENDGKVDNARIKNYMDQKYFIYRDNPIYIEDEKVYIYKDYSYNLSNVKVALSNPKLYIDSLKNIEKVGNMGIDGDDTYYDVTFNNNYLEKILNNLLIKTEVKSNTGVIYIDNQGYIKRIIYNTGKIRITVNYFLINQVTDIDVKVGI